MDLNQPSKLFLLLLKWLIIGYIPMMPCTLLIGPSVVGQSPSVGGSFWCCWSYYWYGLGIPISVCYVTYCPRFFRCIYPHHLLAIWSIYLHWNHSMIPWSVGHNPTVVRYIPTKSHLFQVDSDVLRCFSATGQNVSSGRWSTMQLQWYVALDLTILTNPPVDYLILTGLGCHIRTTFNAYQPVKWMLESQFLVKSPVLDASVAIEKKNKTTGFIQHLSEDLKGSCRNLYMRGHRVENVAQTMERDMVNYLKR